MQCKEAAQRDGALLDSEDQLYKRFIQRVQANLHIVFTMNPSSSEYTSRNTTSPGKQRAAATHARAAQRLARASQAYAAPTRSHASPSCAHVVECVVWAALFNRCVIDWVGDWSGKSLFLSLRVLACAVPCLGTSFAHHHPACHRHSLWVRLESLAQS